MLSVLLLGFVGAGVTGACGSSEPSEAGALGPGVDPPDPVAEARLGIKGTFPPSKQRELGPSLHAPPPPEPAECSEIVRAEPCMLYYLPLLGNPSTNEAERNKYKAAFGDACYNSADAMPTFNCFYRKADVEGTAGKEGQGCTDAKMIADVYGAAPYDKNYKCLPVAGTKDYWLQVGPDPAIHIDIKYGNAPLETSLIDVDGVPTAVSGPYRNLPEPSKVKVGGRFNCYYIDGVVQTERILQMNRKAHGGVIHSDLAGFTWPCNEPDNPICTEETELKAASENDPNAARVHHVVRKTDLRGCKWGTNSNKNAAVISRRLNGFLYNKYPTKEEVDQINAVPPYTP
jgi:hypothetical protein